MFPSAQSLARALRCFCLLLVVVGINGFARRWHAQADLTTDRIYSIHPQTLQLLGRFDDLLRITFYNTGNWGIERQAAVDEIRDTLRLFRDRAGESLLYQEIDPVSFISPSERQDVAQALRQRGIQMTVDRLVVEGNQRETFGYMAIELEYLGRSKVINDPSAAGNLEYRLAAALNLLLQEPKNIGVYADNPAAPAGSFPGLLGGLSEVGDVFDITTSGAIPTEIDVLVVLAPATEQSGDLLRQIDAHIMAGKPALFVVDGLWPYDGEIFTKNISPFVALLEHYGVRVPDRLVGEFAQELAIREPVRTSESTSSVLMNYFKFRSVPQLFDADDPIVRGLGPLLFYCAAPLMPADGLPDEIEWRTLIATSPLADVFGPRIKPYPDPRLSPAPAVLRSYPLAASLKGPFVSYYRDRDDAPQPVLLATEADQAPPETQIVILGGSFSLLADRSAVRFLQNAVEQLAYKSTIGTLRARRAVYRPLRPLDSAERRRLSLIVILAPSILLLTVAWLGWGVSSVSRRSRAGRILTQ